MIEKCFKCEGQGNIHVPEDLDTKKWFTPGSMMKMVCVPCPRCGGSGAVDYVKVEVQQVKAKEGVSSYIVPAPACSICHELNCTKTHVV